MSKPVRDQDFLVALFVLVIRIFGYAFICGAVFIAAFYIAVFAVILGGEAVGFSIRGGLLFSVAATIGAVAVLAVLLWARRIARAKRFLRATATGRPDSGRPGMTSPG